MKIIDIHFTYNRLLSLKLNVEHAYQKFKNILSIWRTRKLTLYGKIIQKLAVSKIFYVCNMQIPPPSFMTDIQREILKFLWSDGTPKIQFKSLISKYEDAGIQLPDVVSKIKTQRIMWSKKLLLPTKSRWNLIPTSYLKQIGGTITIRSNFSNDSIPSKLPDFYKICLSDWSHFVNNEPNSFESVLIQPLWNNHLIRIGGKPVFNKIMVDQGLLFVSDVITKYGKIKNWG